MMSNQNQLGSESWRNLAFANEWRASGISTKSIEIFVIKPKIGSWKESICPSHHREKFNVLDSKPAIQSMSGSNISIDNE